MAKKRTNKLTNAEVLSLGMHITDVKTLSIQRLEDMKVFGYAHIPDVDPDQVTPQVEDIYARSATTFLREEEGRSDEYIANWARIIDEELRKRTLISMEVRSPARVVEIADQLGLGKFADAKKFVSVTTFGNNGTILENAGHMVVINPNGTIEETLGLFAPTHNMDSYLAEDVTRGLMVQVQAEITAKKALYESGLSKDRAQLMVDVRVLLNTFAELARDLAVSKRGIGAVTGVMVTGTDSREFSGLPTMMEHNPSLKVLINHETAVKAMEDKYSGISTRFAEANKRAYMSGNVFGNISDGTHAELLGEVDEGIGWKFNYVEVGKGAFGWVAEDVATGVKIAGIPLPDRGEEEAVRKILTGFGDLSGIIVQAPSSSELALSVTPGRYTSYYSGKMLVNDVNEMIFDTYGYKGDDRRLRFLQYTKSEDNPFITYDARAMASRLNANAPEHMQVDVGVSSEISGQAERRAVFLGDDYVTISNNALPLDSVTTIREQRPLYRAINAMKDKLPEEEVADQVALAQALADEKSIWDVAVLDADTGALTVRMNIEHKYSDVVDVTGVLDGDTRRDNWLGEGTRGNWLSEETTYARIEKKFGFKPNPREGVHDVSMLHVKYDWHEVLNEDTLGRKIEKGEKLIDILTNSNNPKEAQKAYDLLVYSEYIKQLKVGEPGIDVSSIAARHELIRLYNDVKAARGDLEYKMLADIDAVHYEYKYTDPLRIYHIDMSGMAKMISSYDDSIAASLMVNEGSYNKQETLKAIKARKVYVDKTLLPRYKETVDKARYLFNDVALRANMDVKTLAELVSKGDNGYVLFRDRVGRRDAINMFHAATAVKAKLDAEQTIKEWFNTSNLGLERTVNAWRPGIGGWDAFRGDVSTRILSKEQVAVHELEGLVELYGNAVDNLGIAVVAKRSFYQAQETDRRVSEARALLDKINETISTGKTSTPRFKEYVREYDAAVSMLHTTDFFFDALPDVKIDYAHIQAKKVVTAKAELERIAASVGWINERGVVKPAFSAVKATSDGIKDKLAELRAGEDSNARNVEDVLGTYVRTKLRVYAAEMGEAKTRDEYYAALDRGAEFLEGRVGLRPQKKQASIVARMPYIRALGKLVADVPDAAKPHVSELVNTVIRRFNDTSAKVVISDAQKYLVRNDVRETFSAELIGMASRREDSLYLIDAKMRAIQRLPSRIWGIQNNMADPGSSAMTLSHGPILEMTFDELRDETRMIQFARSKDALLDEIDVLRKGVVDIEYRWGQLVAYNPVKYAGSVEALANLNRLTHVPGYLKQDMDMLYTEMSIAELEKARILRSYYEVREIAERARKGGTVSEGEYDVTVQAIKHAIWASDSKLFVEKIQAILEEKISTNESTMRKRFITKHVDTIYNVLIGRMAELNGMMDSVRGATEKIMMYTTPMTAFPPSGIERERFAHDIDRVVANSYMLFIDAKQGVGKYALPTEWNQGFGEHGPAMHMDMVRKYGLGYTKNDTKSAFMFPVRDKVGDLVYKINLSHNVTADQAEKLLQEAQEIVASRRGIVRVIANIPRPLIDSIVGNEERYPLLFKNLSNVKVADDVGAIGIKARLTLEGIEIGGSQYGILMVDGRPILRKFDTFVSSWNVIRPEVIIQYGPGQVPPPGIPRMPINVVKDVYGFMGIAVYQAGTPLQQREFAAEEMVVRDAASADTISMALSRVRSEQEKALDAAAWKVETAAFEKAISDLDIKGVRNIATPKVPMLVYVGENKNIRVANLPDTEEVKVILRSGEGIMPVGISTGEPGAVAKFSVIINQAADGAYIIGKPSGKLPDSISWDMVIYKAVATISAVTDGVQEITYNDAQIREARAYVDMERELSRNITRMRMVYNERGSSVPEYATLTIEEIQALQSKESELAVVFAKKMDQAFLEHALNREPFEKEAVREFEEGVARLYAEYIMLDQKYKEVARIKTKYFGKKGQMLYGIEAEADGILTVLGKALGGGGITIRFDGVPRPGFTTETIKIEVDRLREYMRLHPEQAMMIQERISGLRANLVVAANTRGELTFMPGTLATFTKETYKRLLGESVNTQGIVAEQVTAFAAEARSVMGSMEEMGGGYRFLKNSSDTYKNFGAYTEGLDKERRELKKLISLTPAQTEKLADLEIGLKVYDREMRLRTQMLQRMATIDITKVEALDAVKTAPVMMGVHVAYAKEAFKPIVVAGVEIYPQARELGQNFLGVDGDYIGIFEELEDLREQADRLKVARDKILMQRRNMIGGYARADIAQYQALVTINESTIKTFEEVYWHGPARRYDDIIKSAKEIAEHLGNGGMFRDTQEYEAKQALAYAIEALDAEGKIEHTEVLRDVFRKFEATNSTNIERRMAQHDARAARTNLEFFNGLIVDIKESMAAGESAEALERLARLKSATDQMSERIYMVHTRIGVLNAKVKVLPSIVQDTHSRYSALSMRPTAKLYWIDKHIDINQSIIDSPLTLPEDIIIAKTGIEELRKERTEIEEFVRAHESESSGLRKQIEAHAQEFGFNEKFDVAYLKGQVEIYKTKLVAVENMMSQARIHGQAISAELADEHTKYVGMVGKWEDSMRSRPGLYKRLDVLLEEEQAIRAELTSLTTINPVYRQIGVWLPKYGELSTKLSGVQTGIRQIEKVLAANDRLWFFKSALRDVKEVRGMLGRAISMATGDQSIYTHQIRQQAIDLGLAKAVGKLVENRSNTIIALLNNYFGSAMDYGEGKIAAGRIQQLFLIPKQVPNTEIDIVRTLFNFNNFHLDLFDDQMVKEVFDEFKRKGLNVKTLQADITSKETGMPRLESLFGAAFKKEEDPKVLARAEVYRGALRRAFLRQLEMEGVRDISNIEADTLVDRALGMMQAFQEPFNEKFLAKAKLARMLDRELEQDPELLMRRYASVDSMLGVPVDVYIKPYVEKLEAAEKALKVARNNETEVLKRYVYAVSLEDVLIRTIASIPESRMDASEKAGIIKTVRGKGFKIKAEKLFSGMDDGVAEEVLKKSKPGPEVKRLLKLSKPGVISVSEDVEDILIKLVKESSLSVSEKEIVETAIIKSDLVTPIMDVIRADTNVKNVEEVIAAQNAVANAMRKFNADSFVHDTKLSEYLDKDKFKWMLGEQLTGKRSVESIKKQLLDKYWHDPTMYTLDEGMVFIQRFNRMLSQVDDEFSPFMLGQTGPNKAFNLFRMADAHLSPGATKFETRVYGAILGEMFMETGLNEGISAVERNEMAQSLAVVMRDKFGVVIDDMYRIPGVEKAAGVYDKVVQFAIRDDIFMHQLSRGMREVNMKANGVAIDITRVLTRFVDEKFKGSNAEPMMNDIKKGVRSILKQAMRGEISIPYIDMQYDLSREDRAKARELMARDLRGQLNTKEKKALHKLMLKWGEGRPAIIPGLIQGEAPPEFTLRTMLLKDGRIVVVRDLYAYSGKEAPMGVKVPGPLNTAYIEQHLDDWDARKAVDKAWESETEEAFARRVVHVIHDKPVGINRLTYESMIEMRRSAEILLTLPESDVSKAASMLLEVILMKGKLKIPAQRGEIQALGFDGIVKKYGEILKETGVNPHDVRKKLYEATTIVPKSGTTIEMPVMRAILGILGAAKVEDGVLDLAEFAWHKEYLSAFVTIRSKLEVSERLTKGYESDMLSQIRHGDAVPVGINLKEIVAFIQKQIKDPREVSWGAEYRRIKALSTLEVKTSEKISSIEHEIAAINRAIEYDKKGIKLVYDFRVNGAIEVSNIESLAFSDNIKKIIVALKENNIVIDLHPYSIDGPWQGIKYDSAWYDKFDNAVYERTGKISRRREEIGKMLYLADIDSMLPDMSRYITFNIAGGTDVTVANIKIYVDVLKAKRAAMTDETDIKQIDELLKKITKKDGIRDLLEEREKLDVESQTLTGIYQSKNVKDMKALRGMAGEWSNPNVIEVVFDGGSYPLQRSNVVDKIDTLKKALGVENRELMRIKDRAVLYQPGVIESKLPITVVDLQGDIAYVQRLLTDKLKSEEAYIRTLSRPYKKMLGKIRGPINDATLAAFFETNTEYTGVLKEITGMLNRVELSGEPAGAYGKELKALYDKLNTIADSHEYATKVNSEYANSGEIYNISMNIEEVFNNWWKSNSRKLPPDLRANIDKDVVPMDAKTIANYERMGIEAGLNYDAVLFKVSNREVMRGVSRDEILAHQEVRAAQDLKDEAVQKIQLSKRRAWDRANSIFISVDEWIGNAAKNAIKAGKKDTPEIRRVVESLRDVLDRDTFAIKEMRERINKAFAGLSASGFSQKNIDEFMKVFENPKAYSDEVVVDMFKALDVWRGKNVQMLPDVNVIKESIFQSRLSSREYIETLQRAVYVLTDQSVSEEDKIVAEAAKYGGKMMGKTIDGRYIDHISLLHPSPLLSYLPYVGPDRFLLSDYARDVDTVKANLWDKIGILAKMRSDILKAGGKEYNNAELQKLLNRVGELEDLQWGHGITTDERTFANAVDNYLKQNNWNGVSPKYREKVFSRGKRTGMLDADMINAWRKIRSVETAEWWQGPGMGTRPIGLTSDQQKELDELNVLLKQQLKLSQLKFDVTLGNAEVKAMHASGAISMYSIDKSISIQLRNMSTLNGVLNSELRLYKLQIGGVDITKAGKIATSGLLGVYPSRGLENIRVFNVKYGNVQDVVLRKPALMEALVRTQVIPGKAAIQDVQTGKILWTIGTEEMFGYTRALYDPSRVKERTLERGRVADEILDDIIAQLKKTNSIKQDLDVTNIKNKVFDVVHGVDVTLPRASFVTYHREAIADTASGMPLEERGAFSMVAMAYSNYFNESMRIARTMERVEALHALWVKDMAPAYQELVGKRGPEMAAFVDLFGSRWLGEVAGRAAMWSFVAGKRVDEMLGSLDKSLGALMGIGGMVVGDARVRSYGNLRVFSEQARIFGRDAAQLRNAASVLKLAYRMSLNGLSYSAKDSVGQHMTRMFGGQALGTLTGLTNIMNSFSYYSYAVGSHTTDKHMRIFADEAAKAFPWDPNGAGAAKQLEYVTGASKSWAEGKYGARGNSLVTNIFKSLDKSADDMSRMIAQGVAPQTAVAKGYQQIDAAFRTLKQGEENLIGDAGYDGANTSLSYAYSDNVSLISKLEYVAVNDARTCRYCRASAGIMYNVDDSKPSLPRHNNCRCTYRAWFKSPGEIIPDTGVTEKTGPVRLRKWVSIDDEDLGGIGAGLNKLKPMKSTGLLSDDDWLKWFDEQKYPVRELMVGKDHALAHALGVFDDENKFDKSRVVTATAREIIKSAYEDTARYSGMELAKNFVMRKDVAPYLWQAVTNPRKAAQHLSNIPFRRILLSPDGIAKDSMLGGFNRMLGDANGPGGALFTLATKYVPQEVMKSAIEIGAQMWKDATKLLPANIRSSMTPTEIKFAGAAIKKAIDPDSTFANVGSMYNVLVRQGDRRGILNYEKANDDTRKTLEAFGDVFMNLGAEIARPTDGSAANQALSDAFIRAYETAPRDEILAGVVPRMRTGAYVSQGVRMTGDRVDMIQGAVSSAYKNPTGIAVRANPLQEYVRAFETEEIFKSAELQRRVLALSQEERGALGASLSRQNKGRFDALLKGSDITTEMTSFKIRRVTPEGEVIGAVDLPIVGETHVYGGPNRILYTGALDDIVNAVRKTNTAVDASRFANFTIRRSAGDVEGAMHVTITRNDMIPGKQNVVEMRNVKGGDIEVALQRMMEDLWEREQSINTVGLAIRGMEGKNVGMLEGYGGRPLDEIASRNFETVVNQAIEGLQRQYPDRIIDISYRQRIWDNAHNGAKQIEDPQISKAVSSILGDHGQPTSIALARIEGLIK